MRRTFFVAAVILSGAVLGGCSLIFVDGPPPGHERMEYFTCTNNNVMPGLDLIWGGLNFLGAAAAIVDPDAYEDSSQIITVGIGWAALSFWSAFQGLDKTEECRRAQMRFLMPTTRDPARRDEPLADDVQAIVIEPSSDSLAVGETAQFVATAYNSAGSTLQNVRFVWTSSDEAVATVTSFGRVTARGPGSVLILAHVGDRFGSAEIQVH